METIAFRKWQERLERCRQKKKLSERRADHQISYWLTEAGKVLYKYRCPICASWHLTRQYVKRGDV